MTAEKASERGRSAMVECRATSITSGPVHEVEWNEHHTRGDQDHAVSTYLCFARLSSRFHRILLGLWQKRSALLTGPTQAAAAEGARYPRSWLTATHRTAILPPGNRQPPRCSLIRGSAWNGQAHHVTCREAEGVNTLDTQSCFHRLGMLHQI